MKVYVYTVLASLLTLAAHAQNQSPTSQTQTTGSSSQTAVTPSQASPVQPQTTTVQSQTAVTQPQSTAASSQNTVTQPMAATQPQPTAVQSPTASPALPPAAQQPTPTAVVQPPVSGPLPQLIKNGRMEQTTGASWFFGYYGNQQENPNGYKFEYSLAAAASGEYSLKLTGGPVKNDSVYCSLNQTFPPTGIPIGSKLTLKAKIKTVNMTGEGIAVALRGNKVENNLLKTTFFKSTQGYVPITGTNEFEEYSVTVDSFSGQIDTLTAFVFYLPKTSGAAYVDDVSLSIEPPTPPKPSKKKK